MTGHAFALAMAALGVNGPEDGRLNWDTVNWRAQEDNVRRLRQRIFKATQDGDWAKVRSLQKLMLRSRANTLTSVRRVAQINAGRMTAGVDGEVALTSTARARLAEQTDRTRKSWTPLSVKRVYIPKPDGRQRPLGIPVILDRVHQMRTKNALEPEWEARFEPRSYGFRPGRSCQDAIEAIYWTLNGKHAKRQWVLDADLKAAFDRIDHAHLLSQLDGFPAKDLVRQWLKAGVIDKNGLHPTEEGTPQGGVISPVLMNVALHGLEEAAGVRYSTLGSNAARTVPGSVVLVRYADDLVALCHTRDQAEQVKARLADWLGPRGLAFNEDKTRITHIDAGFDFLGFNIRRYPNGKLLIKPSATAVKRIRDRLTTEMSALHGTNAIAVLRKINPIVRGWAAYYRSVVSKEVFALVDHHLWRVTYKWALRAHPNKSKSWVINQYFDRFNPSRNDRWVFGDRNSGAYMVRFVWTQIVRHQLVAGAASPDDAALSEYWAKRRSRKPLPLDKET
ncbi:group II intron reverse transcriptase/maturase [Streptomyces sp. NBC_00841]|nr:group II intron reverse transcriptase/maturase [Streptomyces sp. NBC_00841]WRZ97183.1 group II intron reverse transcriptase/maturase [Streptomyces sp. NBC_00841]